MKYTLRCPSCTGCPHDLYFGEAIPKKQFSVMMHCGEHFCTGGKKARRFKRSDPKIAVPQWCPKRKSPCELRVYALKSIQDWHFSCRPIPMIRSAYRNAGMRWHPAAKLN